jgi:protein involved in polysaccharide export with SLBB domain
MNMQVKHKKELIVIIGGLVILLAGGLGCEQRPPRVYKVGSVEPFPSRSKSAQNCAQGPYNHTAGGKVAGISQRPSDDSYSGMKGDFASYGASSGDRTLFGSDPSVRRNYHVGPGDVLEVKVFQLVELDRETVARVEVDQTGYVYLPILNHVLVGGMTVEQVQAGLVHLLSERYMRDPKVNVSVVGHNNKKVMVLGHVHKPGEVALETDTSTLLDVISQAGGISGNVAPNIEILRGAYNGLAGPFSNMAGKSYRSELIPVSKLFAEDGHSQVNPVIYPGDVVKVRSLSDGYIYISGEVLRPGSSEFRRPLTILQAVSCAGGASPIAAENKCKVIRRDAEGRETEVIVDLQRIRSGKDQNLLMACNDTILVPVDPVKKFFNDVANLFQMGVRTGVDMTYDAGEQMGIPGSENYRYGYQGY